MAPSIAVTRDAGAVADPTMDEDAALAGPFERAQRPLDGRPLVIGPEGLRKPARPRLAEEVGMRAGQGQPRMPRCGGRQGHARGIRHLLPPAVATSAGEPADAPAP
ncbi:hypothetical protein GCM10010964_02180 [Caldovatus sediminis]|uniref:Uncharacterized protein n=1 Tax=Caldovatus sediminis TaxID=2041189 RepID=A0A8J3EAL0_9PROT|nr:hypothetical protein [Caldovatus sediminis]GGG17538.1 hypothetical protein GCM10010964_02180 [Caldovatus sediminis]